jgi:hypothetical protein
MPAFRGTNIMMFKRPARSIVAVRERGKLHILPNESGKAAIHAYADGSASLGFNPALLPERTHR